jgi:biopolymer transport protein ExbD
MSMKTRPFGGNRHQSEEMALQITSMADIFVIILVFLLKSYATGAVNVTPMAGMTLPLAQAGDQSVEALRVEVSKDAVQLDGQPVVALKGFSFEASDLGANGVSATLGKALEQYRNRQLLIAKANTSVKVDARILVLSDQKTPYSTLKTVLASAALHGYTDFKLAVVRGD